MMRWADDATRGLLLMRNMRCRGCSQSAIANPTQGKRSEVSLYELANRLKAKPSKEESGKFGSYSYGEIKKTLIHKEPGVTGGATNYTRSLQHNGR